MGNLLAPNHVSALGTSAETYVSQINLSLGSNIKDVRDNFESSRYLSPHSDIVALLVLTHQANLHNLITRAGYEARIAIYEKEISANAKDIRADQVPESLRNAIDALVRAMFFSDEQRLTGPFPGGSQGLKS